MSKGNSYSVRKRSAGPGASTLQRKELMALARLRSNSLCAIPLYKFTTDQLNNSQSLIIFMYMLYMNQV